MNNNELFDLVIIGGGINGTGIARDAAGRGYKVCLIEKNDLASSTSSASTKLIHGGLRYLEQLAIKMVRQSLNERNILMKSAPHLIYPIKFVLPYTSSMRSKWILSIGLFLYDKLAGKSKLPKSKKIDLKNHESGKILLDDFKSGFIYSDCWGDDSRLVVSNAMSAREKGAKIFTYTQLTSVCSEESNWKINLKKSKKQFFVKSKLIVNATGPFVDEVLKKISKNYTNSNIRLIKGSHLILKRKIKNDFSYIFQNLDGRIIFLIPYENDFILLGTTDIEENPPHLLKPKISKEEIEYLLKATSKYLKVPLQKNEIISSYSGYRPIYDKELNLPHKANRDYKIEIDYVNSKPIISIFGGKLTTFRLMSEKVLTIIDKLFYKKTEKWTHKTTLPGGDFQFNKLDEIVSKIQCQIKDIKFSYAHRIAKNYGTNCFKWIKNKKKFSDFGLHFGSGLTEAEVMYLLEFEFANSSDDILSRRTKLGLKISNYQKLKLDNFLDKLKI